MKEQVKKEMVKVATFDATIDQNDYLVSMAAKSGGSKAGVIRGLIQNSIDNKSSKMTKEVAIRRIKGTLEWEINTCNNRDWESVADSIICALELDDE